MSASFYDLMKYARTGIASPSMTHYDKMKARAMLGGGFPVTTLTGVPPISFRAKAGYLESYQFFGNTVQNGTPTPESPVDVEGVGELEASGEHAGQYKIPISNNTDDYVIYLTEPLQKISSYVDDVESTGIITRHIKKLVLTGEEETSRLDAEGMYRYVVYTPISYADKYIGLCTHYQYKFGKPPAYGYCHILTNGTGIAFFDDRYISADAFKQWLAAQYANGTPVTVWYVLATPTTETVGMPQIATARGSNTMSVGTTLQPSSVSLTGGIK